MRMNPYGKRMERGRAKPEEGSGDDSFQPHFSESKEQACQSSEGGVGMEQDKNSMSANLTVGEDQSQRQFPVCDGGQESVLAEDGGDRASNSENLGKKGDSLVHLASTHSGVESSYVIPKRGSAMSKVPSLLDEPLIDTFAGVKRGVIGGTTVIMQDQSHDSWGGDSPHGGPMKYHLNHITNSCAGDQGGDNGSQGLIEGVLYRREPGLGIVGDTSGKQEIEGLTQTLSIISVKGEDTTGHGSQNWKRKARASQLPISEKSGLWQGGKRKATDDGGEIVEERNSKVMVRELSMVRDKEKKFMSGSRRAVAVKQPRRPP